MNAVILAGGKGTRLHPLTATTPKPLVNFFDRPVLEHQIELLKREGFDDIIITVGHLRQRIIDRLGDGRKFGVRIRYVCETVPLGTAGGVKLAEELLDETFLIISGDAITDVKLRAAVEFHQAHQALVTLLLKEVEDPSEYGIAEVDSEARITRFLEKPSPEQVFSRTANTGMYVMSRAALAAVPEDEPFDFSKNLFPALLRHNERMFGWRIDGYWNDIGSLTEYLQAHIDALAGKIDLPLVRRDPRALTSAIVHPRAVIKAPSFMGSSVYLDDGAVVGEHAIVGPRARIGASARLNYCVIGEDCIIGEHAIIEDCVLAPGTTFPPYGCIRGNTFHFALPPAQHLTVHSRLDGPVVALVEASA